MGRFINAERPETSVQTPHAKCVRALRRVRDYISAATREKHAVYLSALDAAHRARMMSKAKRGDAPSDMPPVPVDYQKDTELCHAMSILTRLYDDARPGQRTLFVDGQTISGAASVRWIIGTARQSDGQASGAAKLEELIAKEIGADELDLFRRRIAKIPASSVVHMPDGEKWVKTDEGTEVFASATYLGPADQSEESVEYYYIISE
jgi:hypothetical protein